MERGFKDIFKGENNLKLKKKYYICSELAKVCTN